MHIKSQYLRNLVISDLAKGSHLYVFNNKNPKTDSCSTPKIYPVATMSFMLLRKIEVSLLDL